MIDTIWTQMGFVRWPLSFSLLVIVLVTVYSSYRVFRPGAEADLRTKAWIDATLFWGGFAMIWGVLGTLVGITIAAQSIEAAGDVAPMLVWGGIKVALLTSLFGMLILVIASLIWFVLQFRWRLLQADEESEAA
jgi:hypothetical protein